MEEKQTAYQVKKKVIANLVEKITREVETVHSIATGLFGKNIRIKQDPEGMDIWLGLTVKRGASVPEMAKEVQQRLKQEMEKTLGVPMRKIDIVVKRIKS